jgi:hypothetical protein
LLVHAIRKDQNSKNCHKLNIETINYAIDNKVDYLFLAARWTYYINGDYDKGKIQYLSLEENGEKNKDLSKIALFQGLTETLQTLGSSGIHVILMLQVPMQDKRPEEIYLTSFDKRGAISLSQLQNNSVSRAKSDRLQQEVNAFIEQEAKKYKNVTLIRPTAVFCDDTSCPVGNENELFYFDADHLSVVGTRKLQKVVEQSLMGSGATK